MASVFRGQARETTLYHVLPATAFRCFCFDCTVMIANHNSAVKAIRRQISIPRRWAWDVLFIRIPVVRHKFSFGFQLYATNFHSARVGLGCHFHLNTSCTPQIFIFSVCASQIYIPRGWAWDVIFIWIAVVSHQLFFGLH